MDEGLKLAFLELLQYEKMKTFEAWSSEMRRERLWVPTFLSLVFFSFFLIRGQRTDKLLIFALDWTSGIKGQPFSHQKIRKRQKITLFKIKACSD